FVRERHAPIDARGRPAAGFDAKRTMTTRAHFWCTMLARLPLPMWRCRNRCLCFLVGEMPTDPTLFDGAVVFTSRAPVQRYTRTGVFVCVRTLFVTLPSTIADSPPRPCDPMTMRSQPLSEAAAIMAS